MANAMYGLGRAAFLAGSLDWDAHNFKLSLIDNADYTVAIDTHDFYDDVPGGAIVGTSGNLANKTNTLGVADCDDVTISAVSGDPFESIICRRDSGSAATSELVLYIDTATGLPATPNGGDIILQIDSGVNKLFKL